MVPSEWRAPGGAPLGGALGAWADDVQEALADQEGAAEAEAAAAVLLTYYRDAHPPFATPSKVNRLIQAYRHACEVPAGDGPAGARWVDGLWADFERRGAAPLAAYRSLAPRARAAVTLQRTQVS